MSFCPKCGTKTRKEDKFCGGCGQLLKNYSDFTKSSSNYKFLYIFLSIILLVVLGGGVFAINMMRGPEISVPGDYNTIQEAINAAEDGDLIEVEPGNYEENIDFEGKDLTLKSVDPDDKEVVEDTVINGRENGPVVTFQGKESEDAILKGFTITGGSGKNMKDEIDESIYLGGGILVLENSSPEMKQNIITENSSDGGAGVAVTGEEIDSEKHIILKENTITDNDAAFGSGVLVYKANATIKENNISKNNVENSTGGGIFIREAKTKIADNTISENWSDNHGGGITAFKTETIIKNNKIIDNSSDVLGGGIYVFEADLTLENNTINENNTGLLGGGVYVWGSKANIINNTISKNEASYGSGLGIGGAEISGIIVGDETSAKEEVKNTIENNSIKENIAEEKGGGIFVGKEEVSKEGNTFSDNEPDDIHKWEEKVNAKELFDYEITGIEAGAGIMAAAEEAIEAYESLNEFYLIEGSDYEMSSKLLEAVENQEWIVVTGWTPHWKFGKADLKFLEDPLGIFGEAEKINAIARLELNYEHPDIYQFLDEFYIENDDLSNIMYEIDNARDDEAGVKAWAEKNQDMIDSWSLDVDGQGKEIELAYMNWLCARSKTYLVKYILEKEMNYEVSTYQTYAYMVYSEVARGNIDAFVASWQPVTHQTFLDQFGEDLDDLGPVYEGAEIGLVVPEYVDINNIDEMNEDLTM